MGNKTQIYHADTVDEAIEIAMAHWPEPGAAQNPRAGNRDFPWALTRSQNIITIPGIDSAAEAKKEILNIAYGRMDETGLTIGIVGKIWALLCLCPLSTAYSTNRTKRDGTITGQKLAINKFVERLNGMNPGATKLAKYVISSTQFTIPREEELKVSKETLLEIREKVLALVARDVQTWQKVNGRTESRNLAGTRQILHRVMDRDFASVKDYVDLMKEKLNLYGNRVSKEERPPASIIETAIIKFTELGRVIDHDDTPLKTATDLAYRTLTDANGTDRAFVLHGHPQSGKKSVVGDFMRRVRNRSQSGNDPRDLRLQIDDYGDIKAELPFFVVSARNRTYRELLCLVLAYLQLRQGPDREEWIKTKNADIDMANITTRAKHILRANSPQTTANMQGLFKEIEELHQSRPTAFVFLDVTGSERDSLNRLFKNPGPLRALAPLWRSNTQSRFFVTLNQDTAPTGWPEFMGKGQFAEHRLDYPDIRRLRWYLNDEAQKKYKAELQDEQSLEDHLKGIKPNGTGAPPKTPGDALLILALLYELEIPDFKGVAKAFLATGGEAPCDAQNICHSLFSWLDEHQVFVPLMLIVATAAISDRLQCHSLKRLFRQWLDASPDGAIDFAAKWQQAEPELNRLCSLGTQLFLQKVETSNQDNEEHGLVDDDIDQESWQISQTVARTLLDAALASPQWRGQTRDCLRLVARAARRRAQIKRLNRTDDSSRSDHRDIERDVQAYCALLASIPPEKLEEEQSHRALRLELDRAFSIFPLPLKDEKQPQDPGFSAPIALRFAVLCMLRQDIDQDFRLSMLTDQDELRLRLYIIAYQPLGEYHHWPVSELSERAAFEKHGLTNTTPAHITDHFEPKEQIELLLAIALAAYHCHLPLVVGWAWTLAQEFRQNWQNDPRRYPVELGYLYRMDCTLSDMALRTGNLPLEDSEPGLEAVRDWLSSHYNDLAACLGNQFPDAPETEKIPMPLVKAQMRLGARLAGLHWVAGNDQQQAGDLYQEIATQEHAIAKDTGHGEPVAMSGRTARQYLKFLCRDWPVLMPPNGIEQTAPPEGHKNIKLIQYIIEANISRLNKYAGADRIGVLTDLARLHLYNGGAEGAHAEKYLDSAHDRLRVLQISHGGKIDLLLVTYAKQVMDLEAAPGRQTEAKFRNLGQDIMRVREIAENLGFMPATALLYLLAARLHNLQGDLGSAEQSLDKGMELAEGLGFGAAIAAITQWRSELGIAQQG